ncbi:hypothetical protein AtNW77_Chr3g0163151 [Arabidopsis thaliana]
MLRTRLLWFTLGFSVTGGSIAHIVWRDLYAERFAISSDMKEKFSALEGRVSGLESGGYENPNPAQSTENSRISRGVIVCWYCFS